MLRNFLRTSTPATVVRAPQTTYSVSISILPFNTEQTRKHGSDAYRHTGTYGRTPFPGLQIVERGEYFLQRKHILKQHLAGFAALCLADHAGHFELVHDASRPVVTD